MPKKRFSAEQIVALLRQIEVATAQGKTIALRAGKPGYRTRATSVGARSTGVWTSTRLVG